MVDPEPETLDNRMHSYHRDPFNGTADSLNQLQSPKKPHKPFKHLGFKASRLRPKTLNPKPLNPKPLNLKPPNPKTHKPLSAGWSRGSGSSGSRRSEALKELRVVSGLGL